MSTRSRAATYSEPEEIGLIVYLQQRLYENYTVIAYILIIVTYFIAFGEFLYFRLLSELMPEKIIYKRTCQLLANETIVRTGFHYASTLFCFFSISLLQITCFFLLTVSGKWLDIPRQYSNLISLEEKLRIELIRSIKRVMYNTVFPTFLVYIMSSAVVLASIFYMVGMLDEVEDTVSKVFLYCFDVCMILYFLAFPTVCLIYHPDIQFRFTRCRTKPARPENNNTSSVHLMAIRNSQDDSHELQDLSIRTSTV
uniref:Uncharacterized protein n=1 Tax=Acrobeloides nanus TaxID=290746 RepID=A0A914DJ46_9BILA